MQIFIYVHKIKEVQPTVRCKIEWTPVLRKSTTTSCFFFVIVYIHYHRIKKQEVN